MVLSPKHVLTLHTFTAARQLCVCVCARPACFLRPLHAKVATYINIQRSHTHTHKIRYKSKSEKGERALYELPKVIMLRADFICVCGLSFDI